MKNKYISDLDRIVLIGESNIVNDIIMYDGEKECMIIPLMQHIQRGLEREGVDKFYMYRN